MNANTTRRGLLVAVLAGGLGGLTLSSASELLETFAPLSGSAWNAAGRKLPEVTDSPHGDATVRIDDEGVPHVEADDERGAYYAVGYLHGFDRPFQIDLQRRVMRGQLSELVGEATLEDDEFHVTMDFVGAAEATWDAVEGTSVGPLVDAYADGVTAAFERERLTLEFELLGYEPREWTPVDSMLMEKQISWDLTGNFGELRRATIDDRLGAGVLHELYPENLDHDVPIIRDADAVGAGGTTSDDPSFDTRGTQIGKGVVDWLSGFESARGVGSNSWVVSGEYTESGTPILANDPHLGMMIPPLWYEQRVTTPERNVRGVTFPGVPFVIIGANDRGGWGFTNVGADVLDCYRYDIDDAGERYRYDGEWRAFDVEEREIAVAGGENRIVRVKKTVHGPLLEREGERVGIAWTGLSATRTTHAIDAIGRSEGVDDVLAAAEWFDSPTQNLVYADADGRTLYSVTGKLPIREVDGEIVDGNRIFDGSSGEGEWQGFEPYGESTWDGFVPFEEKPHVVDPGVLATANQRVIDDPTHYIGVAYATPYRGARIYDRLDERIDSGEPTDLGFHWELIADVYDERAAQLVPELLAALRSPGVGDVAAELESAIDTLEGWDYEMNRDSLGALLFVHWLKHFRRLVVEPDFAEADLDSSYYPNDWVVATLPADSDFFADTSREEAMVEALVVAVDEIDAEGWDVYGEYNTSESIAHPFGGEAPFLDYDELPLDGSDATVNNYRVESGVASSWRMIVEPGERAFGILPGGNSGDYFSPHYDDQFRRWADGEFKSMDLETDAAVAVSFEGDEE